MLQSSRVWNYNQPINMIKSILFFRDCKVLSLTALSVKMCKMTTSYNSLKNCSLINMTKQRITSFTGSDSNFSRKKSGAFFTKRYIRSDFLCKFDSLHPYQINAITGRCYCVGNLNSNSDSMKKGEQKFSTYQGKHFVNKDDEKSSKTKQEFNHSIKKENVLTIPNLLTTARIVVTPYLGYLILTESFPLACGIFIFAGISDVLDGWIARTFESQKTSFGSFLDPLADKILMSTLYVSLSMVGVIPTFLTAMVLLRDVLLVTAGFCVRYIALPKPFTLKQYFDVTNPAAQLKPLFSSKVR